ncbi:uncharacterized protein LOC111632162 [Centruroides sculpturatus]|uniref:uncharacterized protein LOC111632162 n=1 Tax=Centruroides sculpturatus TaxID=218467 RepID=UPI000C6E3F8A|nr:uncharacterized protein LOC111632162 [Centruroides sculpturatus]
MESEESLLSLSQLKVTEETKFPDEIICEDLETQYEPMPGISKTSLKKDITEKIDKNGRKVKEQYEDAFEKVIDEKQSQQIEDLTESSLKSHKIPITPTEELKIKVPKISFRQSEPHMKVSKFTNIPSFSADEFMKKVRLSSSKSEPILKESDLGPETFLLKKVPTQEIVTKKIELPPIQFPSEYPLPTIKPYLVEKSMSLPAVSTVKREEHKTFLQKFIPENIFSALKRTFSAKREPQESVSAEDDNEKSLSPTVEYEESIFKEELPSKLSKDISEIIPEKAVSDAYEEEQRQKYIDRVSEILSPDIKVTPQRSKEVFAVTDEVKTEEIKSATEPLEHEELGTKMTREELEQDKTISEESKTISDTFEPSSAEVTDEEISPDKTRTTPSTSAEQERLISLSEIPATTPKRKGKVVFPDESKSSTETYNEIISKIDKESDLTPIIPVSPMIKSELEVTEIDELQKPEDKITKPDKYFSDISSLEPDKERRLKVTKFKKGIPSDTIAFPEKISEPAKKVKFEDKKYSPEDVGEIKSRYRRSRRDKDSSESLHKRTIRRRRSIFEKLSEDKRKQYKKRRTDIQLWDTSDETEEEEAISEKQKDVLPPITRKSKVKLYKFRGWPIPSSSSGSDEQFESSLFGPKSFIRTITEPFSNGVPVISDDSLETVKIISDKISKPVISESKTPLSVIVDVPVSTQMSEPSTSTGISEDRSVDSRVTLKKKKIPKYRSQIRQKQYSRRLSPRSLSPRSTSSRERKEKLKVKPKRKMKRRYAKPKQRN